MIKIIFATSNANKIREIKEIINIPNIDIVSMEEEEIKIDIEENGSTYEENALIKARAIAQLRPNEIIMAEDSGLEIDYLHGEPGLYSARYMGHDTPYDQKNKAILDSLKGVERSKRTAQYVCSVVAVLPDRREISAKGILKGEIGEEEKGVNGFGYDPIFFLPQKGCYMSELTNAEKNMISHRGGALREIINKLKEINVL